MKKIIHWGNLMSRAEIRRKQREVDKNSKQLNMTSESLEASLDAAKKAEREKIFAFVVNYYSAAVAMVLHDKWGFGHDRLIRILDQIGDMYDSIVRGYVNIDDVKKTLLKETGVDLNRRFPT